jgi:hypothetical protein
MSAGNGRKHRHELGRIEAEASDLGSGHAYLLYWDPRESAMAVDGGLNGASQPRIRKLPNDFVNRRRWLYWVPCLHGVA